jgi:hypothetical protein
MALRIVVGERRIEIEAAPREVRVLRRSASLQFGALDLIDQSS